MPSPPPRVLSIIPPMTQLNTPYPSTAYLTGFLRSRGVHAVQEDLALALVLKLLSREGLQGLREAAAALPVLHRNARIDAFEQCFDEYLLSIEPVLAFLQGRDTSWMHRIASRSFLPEGPRFDALDAYVDSDGGDPMAWAFGALGTHDRARHLCTLYLNDIADVLRDAVDSRFEFVRYGERLAASQASFDALADALAAPHNLVDRTLHGLALQALARQHAGRAACFIGYDEARAHRLMAGADAIAVPSRFEPCGLTQLYGLRYGTLPVVRRTGGLADTVVDAGRPPQAGAWSGADESSNVDASTGTGFVFDAPTTWALDEALQRAMHTWRNPPAWRTLQRRAMQQDFSWAGPVAAYGRLYRSLCTDG